MRLFFILLINSVFCCAQDSRVDSLIRVCKTSKEDSNLVKRYFQICSHYSANGNNMRLHEFATIAKDLALKLNYHKGSATAYNFLGIAYKEMSNYPEALNNYLKGLDIAIKYDLVKLKVNLYDNIGNIYAERGERNKALDYYNKAINALPDKKNKRAFQTYNNIAVVYAENGDLKNAQSYFQKVYDISKASSDLDNMEGPIGNIGNIYLLQGKTDMALEHFNEALSISRQLGNLNKVTEWLQNIGTLYLSIKDFSKAEKNLKESLAISDSIGALDMIMANHRELSQLYEQTNLPQLALSHYELYVKANDSIFAPTNSNKIIELEMNYEFNIKETEAKLLQEKKDAVKAEEHKKNNFIIFSFSLVLLLLAGLALYIYKSYRAKQRANKELFEQKNIIEEKQREILASIHYAKRIQSALLTSENYIEKNMMRLTGNND